MTHQQETQPKLGSRDCLTVGFLTGQDALARERTEYNVRTELVQVSRNPCIHPFFAVLSPVQAGAALAGSTSCQCRDIPTHVKEVGRRSSEGWLRTASTP